MNELVTIGIPIYKRLEFLPNVLRIVASQDYPNIDLLVSDNGMNGDAVPSIVAKHYGKPYRFRQNAATVSGSAHYNQLIQHAAGEYVIVLADDDEISANFVSDLKALLDKHPQASAALGREEVIDADGKVIRTCESTVPEILSGEDFIRTTWHTREYGLESLCTFLARKDALLANGGFPDIWAATSDEDLLMVKLALDSFIAFSPRSTFRKRYYEVSGGYAIKLQDLARGIREYLAYLDSDAKILEYSASHPQWKVLRSYLFESAWQMYYLRWQGMYKQRLSPVQWITAGFALPFPRYLGTFASIVTNAGMAAALDWTKIYCPRVYTLYSAAKARLKSSRHNTVDVR